MNRIPVPAPIKRAVLVEAGHRCAIPTCRATTTEIAHIVAWEKTQDNSFENLIALCPNDHTRFDQKGEIDRLSVQMYKHNLGILNGRYGEFERRVFSLLAQSGERYIVVGAGGDIMLANAVRDGLLEDKHISGMSFTISAPDGFEREFPMTFTYFLTDLGVSFIERIREGESID
jgi:hypothetical protein